MSNEVRKWIRPVEKIVEEGEKYDSLSQYFLNEDVEAMNVYEIEKDASWRNDVFAVALVNGVKEGKSFLGKDFSEITLAGAFMQKSVLCKSIFAHGNLVAVDFYSSDLEDVDFTACDLRKADFRKCNLKNVNFTGANLAGALFDDSDLTGANFTDSYVYGAKLGSATIDEKTKSEFEKMAQLIDDAQKGLVPLHHLPNSMLRMLDWRRMHLGGVDLSKVDLTGISLVGVNMSGTMQAVMAVPPTYIDYDEEKPQPKTLQEIQNVEIAELFDTSIKSKRPPEKPTIEMQTTHQEYEYIDIYADDSPVNDEKYKKPDKYQEYEKVDTSGVEIKQEKEAVFTGKAVKPKLDSDSDGTDDITEQQAISARIEAQSKRIDKQKVVSSEHKAEVKTEKQTELYTNEEKNQMPDDAKKENAPAKIVLENRQSEENKSIELQSDASIKEKQKIEFAKKDADKNKSKDEASKIKLEEMQRRIDKQDSRTANTKNKGKLRT